MRRKSVALLFCFVLVSSFLVLSCGKKNERVLARVGDTELTLGDFNVAHTSITIFNRPPLVTQEDRERFLNVLINKEVMLTEARKRGLDQDPAVQEAHERWEREYTLRALFKEMAERDLEITLPEVKEHYLKTRARVRARHILVATAESAQELRDRIVAGEDFAALARQNSIDGETAPNGGDLGFLDRNSTDPAVLQAAYGLELNEVSDVVRSRLGFHIVQTLEREDPSMDEFEEARHLCASELRSQRRIGNWRDYVQEELLLLKIEFDQETVSWLNERLPEQGVQDDGWRETITPEEREKLLLTYTEGTWTLGDLLDFFSPEAGRGTLFRTPGGFLIMQSIENELVSRHNLAEGKKLGLHQLDHVTRQIRKKVEEQILDLLHEELVGEVAISEEQVREEYEARKDELIMPESVRFRMINLLEADRAEEAHARALAGESFKELAKEYNTGEVRELEGMAGPLPRESFSDPELRAWLFEKLEEGQMTPVVATSTRGFIIARLLERMPEHNMKYEETRDRLENLLIEQEKDRLLNEWIGAKREEVGVKIYHKVLDLLSEGEEAEAS